MNPIQLRTNVIIRRTPCRTRDKGRLLWARLDAGGRDGALAVRVRNQQASRRMLDLLRLAGRDVRMLTSNQTEAEQAKGIAWFLSALRPALVVAGNLPLPVRTDLRQLYVMNLPPSLRDIQADLDATGVDCLVSTVEFFTAEKDREFRSIGLDESSKSDTLRAELAEALEWIEYDGCARQYIAIRLRGQSTGPCGNCGWCLGKRSGFLPPDR